MNTITISDRMKYRPHGGIGHQRHNIRSAETMTGRSINNNESRRGNEGYRWNADMCIRTNACVGTIIWIDLRMLYDIQDNNLRKIK